MDILIIKLGALGDVVNTLPLAIRLKSHFNARIHWVAEPLSYPLLARHASVDRVILFERSRWMGSLPGLMHELRSGRFVLALDLQRIAKSALFCMAAPAERRLGFDRGRCKEMSWIMPFERIPAADPSAHMVSQYLEFATYLGVPDEEVGWNIPDGDVLPFSLPPDYIVLNIGATKPANRWGTEGFSGLADLVSDRRRLPCVLTGGPEDRETAREILAKARSGVIDLTGRTTIMELVRVLSGARAVVSCDTGPMHLAVALGREVIALFGPADPRRTGPYRGHVIRKDLECSPCNRKTCKDPVCMSSIRAEEVFAELDRFL